MNDKLIHSAQSYIFNFFEDLMILIEDKEVSFESLAASTNISEQRLKDLVESRGIDDDCIPPTLEEVFLISQTVKYQVNFKLPQTDLYTQQEVEDLKVLALKDAKIRAKFLELQIGASSSVDDTFCRPPIGDDDVCDFYIKPKKLEAYFSQEMVCKSFFNGFGIEMKCSVNPKVDIKRKQLHIIKDDNLSGAISVMRRPSDFYLFIRTNNGEHKHPYNYVDSIYLIPTYIIDELLFANDVKVDGVSKDKNGKTYEVEKIALSKLTEVADVQRVLGVCGVKPQFPTHECIRGLVQSQFDEWIKSSSLDKILKRKELLDKQKDIPEIDWVKRTQSKVSSI
ncbi:hypothetical protein [Vibrio sp. D431a]|uniref:hypothetical protein n=1 Tax=Vibrio sp. D431a TaxID=2837388 RepID=UPI0025553379|nr:hypothetical protein [Vibrio sp. D431a]MDK9789887.1 hypothetical protein [Vibrio sp. D431a]